MQIKFVNIKSGEEVTFDSIADPGIRSAHIDAYVNSSDMGINSNHGQDYAWRLAPEVKAEFDEIKSDSSYLATISKESGVMADNLSDGQILAYMVTQQTRAESAQGKKTENIASYEDAYRDKVKAARNHKATTTVADAKPPVVRKK